MRYSPEDKEQACQLYQEGIPPRGISETTGIPLRTIHRWTADIVSELHSFIICEVCGKRRRVLRPRKYCSEKCKKRAYYLRKHSAPVPRRCIECGTQFETRHSRKEYCSKKCQNTAAVRRRRRKQRASQCTN